MTGFGVGSRSGHPWLITIWLCLRSAVRRHTFKTLKDRVVCFLSHRSKRKENPKFKSLPLSCSCHLFIWILVVCIPFNKQSKVKTTTASSCHTPSLYSNRRPGSAGWHRNQNGNGICSYSSNSVFGQNRPAFVFGQNLWGMLGPLERPTTASPTTCIWMTGSEHLNWCFAFLFDRRLNPSSIGSFPYNMHIPMPSSELTYAKQRGL